MTRRSRFWRRIQGLTLPVDAEDEAGQAQRLTVEYTVTFTAVGQAAKQVFVERIHVQENAQKAWEHSWSGQHVEFAMVRVAFGEEPIVADTGSVARSRSISGSAAGLDAFRSDPWVDDREDAVEAVWCSLRTRRPPPPRWLRHPSAGTGGRRGEDTDSSEAGRPPDVVRRRRT